MLNSTGMRVLRERGCGFVLDEAGHRGWNFRCFGVELEAEGVRDGTQKEGRICLDDFGGGVVNSNTRGEIVAKLKYLLIVKSLPGLCPLLFCNFQYYLFV